LRLKLRLRLRLRKRKREEMQTKKEIKQQGEEERHQRASITSTSHHPLCGESRCLLSLLPP
jgi:hypothetical protein